jgi:uncharacterized protein (DUF2252 family)
VRSPLSMSAPAWSGQDGRALTVAERASLGKAARAVAPRETQGDWTPPADRPDPVTVLQAQAKARVPELIPIRYGRMLSSPFAFYRGAAAMMAADLASAAQCHLNAQLCGDAHVANFGVFASPERDLVFDLNDFDETARGSFEWDVKRLVASLAVVSRERGFTRRERSAVVLEASRAYRKVMRSFAEASNLAVWYARLDAAAALADLRAKATRTEAARLRKRLSPAATAGGKAELRPFERLASVGGHTPRLLSDPPLLVPLAELVPEAEQGALMSSFHAALGAYGRTLLSDRRRLLASYHLVDVARKVVGVGSVGTWTWVALLVGIDERDLLFLQFKEAADSVLAAFAGADGHENHGRRVVEGQRLMQATTDALLGWDRLVGTDGVTRDYYVRQLWDAKASLPVERMGPKELATYARLCGWTLARAHARSCDRVAIAAYLGKSTVFDEAMVRFAESYADQNESDYQALVSAAAAGLIRVETGL